MAQIICGNCHHRHASTSQVRDCYFPPAPVIEARLATAKQVSYIKDLGGDAIQAAALTMAAASALITELKKQKRFAPVTVTPAAPPALPFPMALLQNVPDGRFAVRPDETVDYTFYRVSRPKTGNFAGQIKVQSQHSEAYDLVMTVNPDGTYRVYKQSWLKNMVFFLVDPTTASMNYGRKLHHCGRCGKELTDGRSRWFGIGPECEKHMPHIIQFVVDKFGDYVPGADK